MASDEQRQWPLQGLLPKEGSGWVLLENDRGMIAHRRDDVVCVTAVLIPGQGPLRHILAVSRPDSFVRLSDQEVRRVVFDFGAEEAREVAHAQGGHVRRFEMPYRTGAAQGPEQLGQLLTTLQRASAGAPLEVAKVPLVETLAQIAERIAYALLDQVAAFIGKHDRMPLPAETANLLRIIQRKELELLTDEQADVVASEFEKAWPEARRRRLEAVNNLQAARAAAPPASPGRTSR